MTVGRIMIVPALLMMMFVAGCKEDVSGVYNVEGLPGMTVEFKSGKAIFNLGGEVTESACTISGDTVTIAKDPGGQSLTLTRNKDGSLSGPNAMKLVKKS